MRCKTAYNLTFTSGKYYLYRHIRLDKNEPFYIGIGTRQRGHNDKSIYLRAYTKTQRSSFWYNITRKTEYFIEIIYESDDKGEIKEKEMEFIGLYGRKENGGILCNMTDGGDGLNTSKDAMVKRKITMQENGEYQKMVDRLRLQHKKRLLSGEINRKQPVWVYSLDGYLIRKFTTLKECKNYFGYGKSTINNAVKNKRSTKKHIFSFQNNGNKVDISNYNIISTRQANCSKRVKVFDLTTGEENIYQTVKSAAIFMGMKSTSHMTRNLKSGKYKQYKLSLA